MPPLWTPIRDSKERPMERMATMGFGVVASVVVAGEEVEGFGVVVE